MMNANSELKRRHLILGALLGASCPWVSGCSRDGDGYRTALDSPEGIQLSGSAVVPDEELNRLFFLTSDARDDLGVELVEAGESIAALRASTDLSQLFVLSRGVYPRRSKGDEKPRLSVYDGTLDGRGKRLLRSFEMDDPMERLALDEQGKWVAAFAGDATVVNPNELVLFDLNRFDEGVGETQSKTIRSFGGAPEELLFTDELHVPGGAARRFLVVRTDRDVTLIDLLDLSRNEITIKLPEAADGSFSPPAQIAYEAGDAESEVDARLAIRLENNPDVLLVDLGEPTGEGADFALVPNIVDVGGPPSAIEFVRTDGGLRLAALVPSRREAKLVDPETTLVDTVVLPESFSELRLITGEDGDDDEEGDVALLYGQSTSIGFWALGRTSETPYRSVDTAELSFVVAEVIDVPSPNSHLKILLGPGSHIFVLDLKQRQSFPLITDFSAAEVGVSPDGARLWAYEPGMQGFSSVELGALHPQALFADAGVNGVFDIARADGGRTAVILHLDDGWAATVLDAETPDSAETHYFPALHLRGLE